MIFLALAGKMATFKKNMAIFAQNDLVTLVLATWRRLATFSFNFEGI